MHIELMTQFAKAIKYSNSISGLPLHNDGYSKNNSMELVYNVVKRAAKRAVSEAKGRAYEGLYQRLSTKGEREVYKMARFRERKTRDLNQVKCIKDEMDQLLVKGEDIKHRWREYFDNLYNGGSENMDIQDEAYHREPIWVHARKVNHRSNFLSCPEGQP
ncbi:hypothetical protein BS78_01G509100 [Paspalum vaginatum]|nr:hypothetical protein BS78_01G509100 [Paspalum vaginatum]